MPLSIAFLCLYIFAFMLLSKIKVTPRNDKNKDNFSVFMANKLLYRKAIGVVVILAAIYLAFFLIAFDYKAAFDIYIGEYGNLPVDRNALYSLRSKYFNGSLEFVYLFSLGACLYIFYDAKVSKFIGLLAILVFGVVGLLEALVLARYYLPALASAFLLSCPLSFENQKVFQNRFILMFLIFGLGSFGYLGRTVLANHDISILKDRDTMIEGVSMRDSKSLGLARLGFRDSDDSSDFGSKWISPQKISDILSDLYATPFEAPILQQSSVMTDAVCNVFVGPVLDEKVCPKVLQKWLVQTYKEYYSGLFGPVIPTYKYWQFAPRSLRLIMVANLILLLLPLYIVFRARRSYLVLVALSLFPYWVTRLVSFFRGDPLHTGFSFLWISVVLAIFPLCLRRIKTKFWNQTGLT